VVSRLLFAPAVALLALLPLEGCGSAADGVASVHGRLFAQTAPWDTSFDFAGTARIHGAGPFRVIITDSPRPLDEPSPPVPLRAIHIALAQRPQGRELVLVGAQPGPDVLVESRTAAFAGWPEPPEAGLRLPDGSFLVRAVSGFVELEASGDQPGDGVGGRFVLELPTGLESRLERLEGAFAGALLD
jgi:hypothetical protein